MNDLKYRKRISTSVDCGLYVAIHNHSIDSMIPLSRLMDEAIANYLKKIEVSFTLESPRSKISR